MAEKRVVTGGPEFVKDGDLMEVDPNDPTGEGMIPKMIRNVNYNVLIIPEKFLGMYVG